jgi:hypothetical protein
VNFKYVFKSFEKQRRIFMFSFGGVVDKYRVGGGCCLLWPGPGGNVQKGQGKCLTKLVF